MNDEVAHQLSHHRLLQNVISIAVVATMVRAEVRSLEVLVQGSTCDEGDRNAEW